MSSCELSIIIVNYKTPDLTLKCIESIKETVGFNNYEIIVVDNCSNDNSQEIITKKNEDVVWINNPNNDGFGRANNVGISNSKGEYILLINSDVTVLENTIEKCLETIKAEKNIGALGCRLLNEDDSLQKSVYYHTSDYSEILEENLFLDYIYTFKHKEIKALMGSFLLIPKKVFEQVKGFDPDFFMYCEELDLCRRITSNGYKLKYLDEVSAYHLHGASSSGRSWVRKQTYLSKALLVYKEKGILGYIFYHFLFTINTITNFILMWLLDKGYRKGFWTTQVCYYGNYLHYLTIPFLYSRQYGTEKRILRRN